MTAAVKAAPKKDDAAESKTDPFDVQPPLLAISDSLGPPGPAAPVALEEPPKEPFDWGFFSVLLWERSKFLGWVIVTKSIVAVVYEALMSQGLRYVLPDMGMKLYKLPGLAFLEKYAATYRLDLAHVFALVPLVSAFILWSLNLEMYLRPEVFAHRFRNWDLDRVKRVVVTMGVIIITGDAGLFCAAVTLVRWGQARLSPAAVLATAVYVTVLGFVTWVSIWLKDGIEEAKKNNAKKKDEEF